MKRDNSYLHGTKNPNAKLTQDEVNWIKRNGVKFTSSKLAKRFNVHKSTINRIIAGTSHAKN